MFSSCCARVFIFVIDALVIGAPLGIIRSTPVQHLLCREIQSFCCQMFLTEFLDKPLHSIGQATAFHTWFNQVYKLFRGALIFETKTPLYYAGCRLDNCQVQSSPQEGKGLGVDDGEHAEDSLYNTCIVYVCVCVRKWSSWFSVLMSISLKHINWFWQAFGGYGADDGSKIHRTPLETNLESNKRCHEVPVIFGGLGVRIFRSFVESCLWNRSMVVVVFMIIIYKCCT